MNNTSDAPSGVILSVQMINFMKHDNLIIPFKPNVNFITGRNGSGKSSILVALTIGLGGTSRTVGRGSNLSDLIKDGRHEATIIIQIKNTPNGYEELVYGPIITITRRIRPNSSSYEINNCSKKDRAREELTQILQFFSIQVDNPCTLMSQDISKEFIGVSTPHRKYELFMKGTLLSRLEDEIYKIRGNIQYVEKLREERKIEMGDIDLQLAEKKRLYDIVMEYDDISQRIRSLQDEIVWAQYNEEKKESDKIVKYLEENTDLFKIQSSKVAKIKDDYNIINIKYSKSDEKRRAKHLEIATLKKKIESIEKLKNQNSAQLSEKKGKLKLRKNKIVNIKNDIESKTSDLKKLMKKREIADEESHQKQYRFIAEQEENRDILQGKLSKIDHELEQIKVEINRSSSDIETAKNSLKLCQSRYEDLKQKRNLLKSLSSNDREDMSIHSRIDKNLNLFSYRPIGPIGHYIHIREQKWGIAAQHIFGRLLKSFIVNSNEDERKLREIVPDKIPIIITNFNITTNININPINYPCCINSLDSIEISSFEIRGKDGHIINAINVITNVFIDILNADRIWIFENPQDARDASFKYRIPTFTLSGSNFKVQGGYEMRVGAKFTECKIGQSDQMRIQQLDTDIHHCKEKIEEKKASITSIDRNHYKLKSRKNELLQQRDEINKKLNEIEILIRNPPDNDFDYNDQIKNIEERIEKLKKDQDEYEKSVIIIEEEIIPLKEEKEKLKSELKNLSEEINHSDPITNEIDIIQDERNSIKAKLDIEEKKLKQLEEKIKEIEKKVEESTKKVDEDFQKAKIMFPGGELKFKNNCRPINTLVTLLQTEISNYNEIQNSKNIDFSAIQKDYHDLKKQYDAASKYLKDLDEFIDIANTALEKREEKINHMRVSYTRRAKISFLSYQSKRKFDGKLKFNHIEKEITIKIKNRNDTFYTDVSELSGGEKSFALVSLLLSLWSLMDTPFYAIDEFDVFMDDINRQAAMALLIDGAKKMENKQFIFITPLSLDNLRTDKIVSVFELN